MSHRILTRISTEIPRGIAPPHLAYTVRKVAEMLSVSMRTVWRLLAEGKLRRAKVRRGTRVLAVSVMEFVSESEG